jgi:hypothetical protein
VKGGFANVFFIQFIPCKKLCNYPKVAFEMCALKSVKILGKVVKIRVFM